MKKCGILFLLIFIANSILLANDSTKVSSPDKQVSLRIQVGDKLSYSVLYNGAPIVDPSVVDIQLKGGVKLSANLAVAKKEEKQVDETIVSPVPEKRKTIRNQYNELTVHFKQPFSVIFRVYNDGVAYRLVTRFKDSIVIQNEVAEFSFAKGQEVILPLMEPRQDVDRFHTSFEELYKTLSIDSISDKQLAYNPVLVGAPSGLKVGICESDLEDYPGMFLSGHSAGALHAVFAPYPLKEKMTDGEFPQSVVVERADYIARTKGTRNLPWRVLMIAADDKDLPNNDLVYRLASASRVQDISWIHPGKGTDEWITGINLFNVPFKAGLNTATYKYYIDFAKQFGLERIMMDAGWSNYKNLFDINPDINMDTIAAYARQRGIKLSMWTLCSTLDRQLDSALAQFNKWGVDFIMTDFMDRDDQKTVGFYYRVAEATARHKIMVMFHGAFPPKGFNRTYPHAVTREGVLGSEFNIWSDKPTPEHDVTLPFTRMLAGPMDYEPGLLNNATKAQFRSIDKMPMSQGTRCHQLAMFIVYESPIQLFSGNISQGLKEPEFMRLLGSIPTTWSDTKVLEGKVGDYIITARKTGDGWFIGGMTDWTEREFDIQLGFLQEGVYELTSCTDGLNANNYPADYSIAKSLVKQGDNIHVKMAKGGGFLFRLTKNR